ncbi:PLP-dependent aminotransferase family protein [Sphingomonadales bacterium 56]|uniref:MocR-like transcription factor YczR n=1 Tax=unclassified Sphingobium TaxID=2611147 RepID=UPI001919AF89|nr:MULTISPECIES: PLP-dependent aminotransferase family protein [unclassified Sphingobium]MBY2929132.1 PLP-dependent aminotransferase family protein [Sphingomonadales bacterium 56]MBY2959016.1 PLP-dependent aminotransferase family protein [Sphingomonadales bacterium 58]CAD7338474.1 Histidinol-phosphate aminotransferase [Sphingobium sp. S6]CAD7338495.1 Histidinol-phosphate aminotransferase [Sphingobium sp. S8]
MSTSALRPPSLLRLLGAWRVEESAEPAYRQLAQALRMLVLDGRVGLNVRLPGERELAAALGLSRTTIAAAFDRLRDEGYLESRQGSGSVTRLPTGRVEAEPPELDMSSHGNILNWTHAALPAAAGVGRACKAAVEALPAFLGELGYDPLGLPPLRRAIAAQFERRGCPTSPDQIIVTNGAQQGFALLMQWLTGPGDRVVIDHPTYHNVIQALQRSHVVPVPVGLPDQGWDIDAMEAAFRQTSPRFAYIIADFHNPTGRSMDPATRRALVAAAARTHTPLIIDETMVAMGLDFPAPPPVAIHDPSGRQVISMGSASKIYWGGLRVGWIRADPQTIAALGRLRTTMDMASPVVEQLAAAQLIDSEEGLGPRTEVLRARRDHLIAEIEKHLPHWRVESPAGGLSLWAELPRAEATALAAIAESHGVRVAPGPRFGVSGAFERFLRLPFTLPEEQLTLGVERLAEADARLHARLPRGRDSLAAALEADRLI